MVRLVKIPVRVLVDVVANPGPLYRPMAETSDNRVL